MEDKKKKLAPAWKPGQSGNPNGRPVGIGKPISTLRSTLNKLKELEARSIDNISAVVNGQLNVEDKESGKESFVDKTMLETSKWVISTISSMSRAASAEEQLKFEMKNRAEDKKEEKKEGTTGKVVPMFRTKLESEEDE